MKNTEYLSREERLEGFNTIAECLMSGDSKEVKEFAELLNWQTLTIHCWEFMDIKFIRKYQDSLDWGYISTQTLTEDFIREFYEYIDWETICERQQLSEELIREFADFVDWEMVDCFQHISNEFREEFKEYLEETE
jgi:hypothetical protein